MRQQIQIKIGLRQGQQFSPLEIPLVRVERIESAAVEEGKFAEDDAVVAGIEIDSDRWKWPGQLTRKFNHLPLGGGESHLHLVAVVVRVVHSSVVAFTVPIHSPMIGEAVLIHLDKMRFSVEAEDLEIPQLPGVVLQVFLHHDASF